jgi:hypothetical protein
LGCLQKRVHIKDRKSPFVLIAIHIQFLVGIILYFVSPNGLQMIKAVGMGGLTTESRLLALEHPLINIYITLITIGCPSIKKLLTSESKFKTFSIFYGLGLVLSRILGKFIKIESKLQK